MRRRRNADDPYYTDEPGQEQQQEEPGYDMDYDVDYIDYSRPGFEEPDYMDEDDELDNAHRFHIAMNIFDVISILAGLALILVLVAILISLVTWLQSDLSQSFTLLTSGLQ